MRRAHRGRLRAAAGGAKRTILTEILGLPLAVSVESAKPHDVQSARRILKEQADAPPTKQPKLPGLRANVADRGYTGLAALANGHGLALDIKRPPAAPMLPPAKPRKGKRTFTPLAPLDRARTPSPGSGCVGGSRVVTSRLRSGRRPGSRSPASPTCAGCSASSRRGRASRRRRREVGIRHARVSGAATALDDRPFRGDDASVVIEHLGGRGEARAGPDGPPQLRAGSVGPDHPGDARVVRRGAGRQARRGAGARRGSRLRRTAMLSPQLATGSQCSPVPSVRDGVGVGLPAQAARATQLTRRVRERRMPPRSPDRRTPSTRAVLQTRALGRDRNRLQALSTPRSGPPRWPGFAPPRTAAGSRRTAPPTGLAHAWRTTPCAG